MDQTVRRAVERSLELVGESVAQLRQGRPDVARQITEAARIVGFRNVLAHEFWKINPLIVRFVIRERLPNLRVEVAVLRRAEST